jgi:tRNA pseudouridine(55) synthase
MIEFYKELGLTPLEFINNIKKQYPDKKICYTARLDPMARGVVPILFGEECKQMHMYTNLSKRYEVQIMIGYKTDTDDALGILETINIVPNILNYQDIISKYKSYFEIENEITINQKFHYYSTKSLLARSKNIDNYESFYHNVKLFSSKIISNNNSGKLNFTEWVNECCKIINKVDKSKNFRQKEIIEQWQKLKLCKNITSIEYITLQLHVGSGFFVRQFIRDISDKIGIPLMCYDINRISIDYIKNKFYN